ncbi:MAG: FHA domain-containing protein [Fimbriimonadales bacterium]
MQLVGLKGLHWTQTFPLAGPEITIGREAGNTIVCDGDSRVSRRHARLIPAGSSYQIEDLGSSNGTFVNGVRISVPTPLNPGDEITIGGQSYRFEPPTTQPFVAPPGPIQQRPKEVSRTEQAQAPWTRGTERIYGSQGGDIMKGCAMPQLNLPDLSGCLRALILILIALAVLMVLAALLMLAGMGIGMLGGALGGHHGHPGPSTTGGGGGGSPAGAPPGGGSDQQGGESIEGIYIRSALVAQTWHASLGHSAPRLLISWDNFTKGPIHKITATLTTLDSAGHPLVTTKNVVIYDGKPVAGGESHDDTEAAGDGVDPPGGGYPAGAKVDVTSWE